MPPGKLHFDILQVLDSGIYMVFDQKHSIKYYIYLDILHLPYFSIGKWYAEQCIDQMGIYMPGEYVNEWLHYEQYSHTLMGDVMEWHAECLLLAYTPYISKHLQECTDTS